jgi:hypothetical protein
LRSRTADPLNIGFALPPAGISFCDAGSAGNKSLHSKAVAVQELNQLGRERTWKPVDARCHPRFKLEAEIRVYPRDSPVVPGHTVDISESGISAMLRLEVPLGELVRLEFSLPIGEIEVLAMVRQRTAFRYGFQFVDSGAPQDMIRRNCRELAVEYSTGA